MGLTNKDIAMIQLIQVTEEICGYVTNGEELQILPGNREINQKHVLAIKKAMLAGKNLPPIEVSRDGYIIDGQHRYEAAKQLWEEGKEYELLIHIFDTENPLLDAINYNNTQLSWNIEDYIKAYSIDNINYKHLLEWVKSIPKEFRNPKKPSSYLWDTIIALLGSNTAKVKSGDFIFPTLSELMNINGLIEELRVFEDRRMLLRAYAKAWKEFRIAHYSLNFEVYLSLWKNHFEFPDKQYVKDIYESFEFIYNNYYNKLKIF